MPKTITVANYIIPYDPPKHIPGTPAGTLPPNPPPDKVLKQANFTLSKAGPQLHVLQFELSDQFNGVGFPLLLAFRVGPDTSPTKLQFSINHFTGPDNTVGTSIFTATIFDTVDLDFRTFNVTVNPAPLVSGVNKLRFGLNSILGDSGSLTFGDVVIFYKCSIVAEPGK